MLTFRVTTFNVNGSTYGEGPHGWEQRATLTSRRFCAISPTLLGFRVQSKNLETYQDRSLAIITSLGTIMATSSPQSSDPDLLESGSV